MSAWRADPSLGVPKDLNVVIVKYGVPHALRGAVWPLLAKISEEKMSELKEAYRVLNTRWTPHDQAIQRDIGRTFPAHQYFKESGEAGQEALYRVCKAYSLYDSEVGYCQGQSFLGIDLELFIVRHTQLDLLFTLIYDSEMKSSFLLFSRSGSDFDCGTVEDIGNLSRIFKSQSWDPSFSIRGSLTVLRACSWGSQIFLTDILSN